MDIHVVRPGDTMWSLAQRYGVSMSQLLAVNQLPDPSRLVVGQTVLVRYPQLTHTVQAGDTLWSIAQMHQTSVKALLRNDPALRGRDAVYPGQVLVVEYDDQPEGVLSVNGYAYPYIDRALLTATLPYLSQLTPFTYRFTPQGQLIAPQDQWMADAALQMGTAPVFHLSNLDEQERFSPQLAHALLIQRPAQQALISQIVDTVKEKGYRGVDVDFESIDGQDSALYAQFLGLLRQRLHQISLPLTAALAPKTSDNQPGRSHEGHDYGLIAQNVDFALLMTYDWGWAGGPPMAVAPIDQVRRVVDYALTRFSPGQLYLGIPNYGYDWPLPFREGIRARSVNNVQAVQLAWEHRQAIGYDQSAQAPWFRYTDGHGREHMVWFEDARSIQAKLELALEKGLYGVSYWNLDRPFPQSWQVVSAMAQIRPEMAQGMDFSGQM